MISAVEDYVAGQTGLNTPIARGTLQKWQCGALNRQLARARASRFYRDYPAGLDDLSELSALPLIDGEMLRAYGPSMVCVSQSQIARVVTMATSGTTGRVKRLYYTAADLERTVDFFAAGLREVVSPGERMLILMPNALPDSVGDLIAQALDKMGAVGIKAPVPGSFADYDALLAQGVETVVGLPGQLLALARCLAAWGRSWRPRRVLCSADWLSPGIRRALEDLWGDVLVDHYGSTECGLGGAIQCSARGGRHIRESDLLCEIIDPASGRPVPDGEWGELVITTLQREAMPLIRCRTGDWTRIWPKPCPCGSTLAALDAVHRLDMHPLLAVLDEALWPIAAVVDFVLRDAAFAPEVEILAAGALTEAQVRECLQPWPQAASLVIRIQPVAAGAAPLAWGKRRLL